LKRQKNDHAGVELIPHQEAMGESRNLHQEK